MDGSLWSSGYTVVTSVGTSCSTEFTEVQFFPQCTIDDPGCTAVANVSNMHDATSNSCITDIDMFIEDKLGYEQPLLGLDYFITTACKTTDINTYRASAVFIANGSCLRGRGAWYQASMDPTTGATTMSYYTDAACEERSGGYDPISRAELCAHTCNSNIKFYSIPASAAGCATESTSVSTSHDNESTSASTSNETEWTPTSDSSATDSTTSGTESTSGTGTIAGAVGGGEEKPSRALAKSPWR
ncbi:hypothetical protein PHYPSEUDO_008519 [Phytophthora pseudosyringae]|uniref:Uncharacterized protein n=1 Tax=Phytophthora pseudosyringae TaxID=221518 RepID=A0A8T1VH67_9STRA|nr:hypothetical protein PHYPSEUDO_008519 [Phytophthora pseudosyringae]